MLILFAFHINTAKIDHKNLLFFLLGEPFYIL